MHACTSPVQHLCTTHLHATPAPRHISNIQLAAEASERAIRGAMYSNEKKTVEALERQVSVASMPRTQLQPAPGYAHSLLPLCSLAPSCHAIVCPRDRVNCGAVYHTYLHITSTLLSRDLHVTCTLPARYLHVTCTLPSPARHLQAAVHAAEKEELVEAAREQAAREAQEAREAAVREAVTSCKASMQAKHEEAMERLRAESEKREKNAAEAAAAEKARFKAATEGRAQELLREGLTKLESVTDDAQRQARAVESTACALRVRRGEREGGREREGERGRGERE